MGRQNVDIPKVVEKWGESGLVKFHCRCSSRDFSFSVLFSALAGYFIFSSTIINYGGVEDFQFIDVGRADELICCSRSEAAAMGRI